MTQEISRSSVKSDDVYKLFKLNPFTIRPPNRAPQPTSRPRPNNRGGYPPVSEMDQLTTSGVDGAQPTTPATVSGTSTKLTTSGRTTVSGTTTKTKPGINTLVPVTPMVSTSRRWIRW